MHQDTDHSHRALHNEALINAVWAAEKGWAPADILHVLGPKVHPLLYRAAPRVPARISSPVLRKQWLQLAPPRSGSLILPEETLRKLSLELLRLPKLRDTELLVAAAKDHQADIDPKQAKIREKINNLLRKAESTPFENEADALIAKAQSLQQRYRVEDVFAGHAPDFLARRVHIHAPYVKHQASLLGVVAYHNGCASILAHEKGIACVVGTAEDSAHVAQLFDSLSRQCDWYMRSGDGAAQARSRGETAAYRRSFWLSYAARISELLDEANFTGMSEAADARTAETGNEADGRSLARQAIPALYERQVGSEEARNRLFPHLSAMTLSASSWAGVHDGASAAEKSHLAGDSIGSSSQRQIAS
ncbi:DUF2786 domain-containing protein [Corynebacterium simulans]|uniref:DUF2786 domain-containing protein n=1 Tax=Corynebacterium simulans TaxID=146827 RepID=UPI00254A6C25|nr:DUF2786 domain-containing protein [Corynebacterium simulans]MDK7140005.1 DUF2786 domain-containing protein [Corynebacterium simulans]